MNETKNLEKVAKQKLKIKPCTNRLNITRKGILGERERGGGE